MIEKIDITNFKGIKSLVIDDLKQINFFIGGNNCYKTSILEAVALAKHHNINRIITNTKYNTYNKILSALFYGQNYENVPKIKIDSSSVNLEIILNYKEEKKAVSLENEEIKEEINSVSLEKEEIREEVKKIYTLEICGSIVNTEKMPQENSVTSNEKSQTIKSKSVITEKNGRILEYTSPDKTDEEEKYKTNYIYIPSSRKKSEFLRELRNLQENKNKEGIISILKNYDERIEDVIVDGQQIYINLTSHEKLLPIDSMGDGLISACVIASSLVSNNSAVLLIDEIENGLYKDNAIKLIKFILEIIKGKDIQLLVTTHSEEFLKYFYSCVEEKEDISKVFRVEKDNDKINLVVYDNKLAKYATINGWEMR